MKSFCIGLLSIAGMVAAGSTLAATAEETYKGTCGVCHDACVAGAPKLGD